MGPKLRYSLVAKISMPTIPTPVPFVRVAAYGESRLNPSILARYLGAHTMYTGIDRDDTNHMLQTNKCNEHARFHGLLKQKQLTCPEGNGTVATT